MTAAHDTDIIEGSFRVVSSRPIPARGWASPGARRMVARIVLWNCVLVLALVFAPQLIG